MQNIEKWIYEIRAHRSMVEQKALSERDIRSMKSFYKWKTAHSSAVMAPKNSAPLAQQIGAIGRPKPENHR
ncbi:hypothetical protein ACO2I3_16125 [Leptospira interrogans]